MAGYGDGAYGTGPYSFGDSFTPYILDDLLNEFPEQLPRAKRSRLRQYGDRHEDDKLAGESDLEYVDRKVDEVDGDELDDLGWLFGSIGDRKDRNHSEYRYYLHRVTESFMDSRTGAYGSGGFGEGLLNIGLDNRPVPVLHSPESTFKRYVDAHGEEMSRIDSDIEYVLTSRQVNHASGDDLDMLGDFFGPLADRHGRDDAEYRQYLKSIVESFKGRGTRDGIKFAVAGGMGVDPSAVELIDHFDELENTILIDGWGRHHTGRAETMFQLASPSVVQLRTPLKYNFGDNDLDVVADLGDHTVTVDPGLGSGTVGGNTINHYADASYTAYDSATYDSATYE